MSSTSLTCRHIAMGVFDVFQIPYSAVQREHEASLPPLRQGGISSGRAARERPPTASRQYAVERWQQAHLDDLLSARPRWSSSSVLPSPPDMDTNIVGTVNPAHCRTTSMSCGKAAATRPVRRGETPSRSAGVAHKGSRRVSPTHVILRKRG